MTEAPTDPILMTTNVGSHMWGMQTPESDTDLFHLFQVPTSTILRGESWKPAINFQSPENDIDHVYNEVGHAIAQLIRGNVNIVWAFTSPLLIGEPAPEVLRLRELARNSISKRCFHSINGLATGNIKKYIEAPGPLGYDGRQRWEVKRQKTLNLIARTLVFGTRLLKGEGLHYDPFTDATPTTIYALQTDLKAAYESSPLPEECPNKDLLLDWLENRRLPPDNRRQQMFDEVRRTLQIFLGAVLKSDEITDQEMHRVMIEVEDVLTRAKRVDSIVPSHPCLCVTGCLPRAELHHFSCVCVSDHANLIGEEE